MSRRVVLLPGLDGTGALFSGLVRAAGREARLEPIALPPEPLSYVALAAQLGPALGLMLDTVLVAESYSGPLAVLLAAAYPVGALVLCNSFVSPPRAPGLGVLAQAPLFRLPPPRWAIRALLVGGRAADALVTAVRGAVATQPPATLAARLRSVLAVDVGGALGRSSPAVTYLRGTSDRLVPEASVAEIERAARTPLPVVRLRARTFRRL